MNSLKPLSAVRERHQAIASDRAAAAALLERLTEERASIVAGGAVEDDSAVTRVAQLGAKAEIAASKLKGLDEMVGLCEVEAQRLIPSAVADLIRAIKPEIAKNRSKLEAALRSQVNVDALGGEDRFQVLVEELARAQTVTIPYRQAEADLGQLLSRDVELSDAMAAVGRVLQIAEVLR